VLRFLPPLVVTAGEVDKRSASSTARSAPRRG
jgi:hypothetical protein